MHHELPGGKLVTYDIDLSYMTPEEFDAMQIVVGEHAYITENYPGKRKLKVYWNLEESPAAVIGLPPNSVTPCPGNR